MIFAQVTDILVFAPPNQAYRVRSCFMASRQGKKELSDYVQELRTLLVAMRLDHLPKAVILLRRFDGSDRQKSQLCQDAIVIMLWSRNLIFTDVILTLG